MDTRLYTQATGNARRKAGKDAAYRRKVPSWCTWVSLLVLVAVSFGAAFTAEADTTTVTTDHTAYGAGDVAIIIGSGYEPGEVVALEITQAPLLHPADTLDIIGFNQS